MLVHGCEEYRDYRCVDAVALIFSKAQAVLPTITFAASVQMST